MRSVSVRLEDLQKIIIPIGFVGENEHTRVLIDAGRVLDEYPEATATLTVAPPYGDPYPAVVTRDGKTVIWDVTDSDLIQEGQGEIQLSFTVGEVVAKSYIGRTRVNRSIVPASDIPDPMDDWLTRAGALLDELEGMTASAETLAAGESATAEITEVDGHKNIAIGVPRGPKGDDGFSPNATVNKVGNTATIWIVDKTGGHSAKVYDGTDGQDGQDGTDGVTFTPAVSSEGVISWTNDGGQQNPQSVDLVAAVISALPSAVGVSF